MKIELENVCITDTNDMLVAKGSRVYCGCDNPKLAPISFIDGKDYYEQHYRCECGNEIFVKGKREHYED